MSKETGFDYSDREFIKLNRKILNWQWYSDPCTRDVFIHCLLKANWKSVKWHGYQYHRGQFITSLPSLSSELGLSVRSVRTALDHLKSTGELTDWHDSKIRMITVVNYERYQSSDSLNGRRPTGNRQTLSLIHIYAVPAAEQKHILIFLEKKNFHFPRSLADNFLR